VSTPALTDLSIGDVVIDRDDATPNPAVVVNQPSETAADWTAFWVRDEPVTVAEDNPEYDAGVEVVIVVYLEMLREEYPEWAGGSPLRLTDLNERGITFYAFPRQRVKRVDELEAGSADGGDGPSLAVGFRALSVHLDHVGEAWMDGSETPPALVTERNGVTYQITADGRVEGAGPLVGRLEKLASDYLR